MEAGTTTSLRTLAPIAIAFAIVIAYAPVASFDFVNYDDNEYVYANPMVTGGLTAGGIVRVFTSFHAANWHPVTWLSHMVDVQLFGLTAGRHHAINVLLHLLNALLLYVVLQRMTQSPWASGAVAALFALHPLNVETVAWISERKSLLSTTAWLLAIDAYRRWTVTRTPQRYLLLTLVFIAGLMSKPMIVTLPATLLLLDIWPLKRIPYDDVSSRIWRRAASSLLLEKVPLFALAVVSSAITIAGQKSAGATSSSADAPIFERVINALNGYVWYLEKTFVPADLCVLYPHPAISGIPASRPLALLAVVLFAAAFLVAVQNLRNRPWLLVGFGWYAVTLLPVIGIIQVGSQSHADRYAYVPLIGIFIAFVWTARDLAIAYALPRPATGLAACVVIALLTVATRQQLATWRNSETLFKRAIEVHGGRNPIARRNLASYYSDIGSRYKASGDLSTALHYFKAAASVHTEPGILYNEAAVLSDLRRYFEAIPLYVRSLTLDASNADGWLNLGDAQVVVGDYESAISSYRRVLAIRDDKYAWYGLAYACANAGDRGCAASAYGKVRAMDPELANALPTTLR